MKLSWGLFFSSLCSTATAARPSVTPETARLIIAQRLGLSRYHSIQHADEEAIRHINAYGGKQQKLFGAQDSSRSRAHLLMWIEDADQEDATVIISDGSSSLNDFKISGHPSAAENQGLINDFVKQAESLPALADPKKRTYQSTLEIDALLPSNNKLHTYNDYLSIWRVDKSDKAAYENLSLTFSRITTEAEKLGFAFTIVTMPATSSHTKRAANPWGTYEVPALKEARRENPEMILSSNPAPSTSPAPPVTDLEDFPVIVNQASNDSPVRGILPSCFNTLSACQKQTHNCSSHGECKLLHKGRGSGSNRQTLDCYGCACVPTIKHVDEDKGMESKRKVTYWGGPACQKRDISVQFWLFVAVGVVLAFLVSSGIGMLYTMGSEELPSVIGAGVSGPVRK
ncbi:hypothetical protein FB567DRAFT_629106 [Paraphoma chrysanthemicola]|uniref:DUF3844 domain-containing protein n=1 Tax=Paraphoma chrysanthemicola TaxID=798071 RepID=A0A8K0VXU1_9PLEO|nr:hypothetical protein FB567DRAFT_629106 [Paraphoma chrysanthemicola]